MMRWLLNVYHLGIKELSSFLHDVVMMFLIVYTFTVAIYSVANGVRTEVVNATIAVVDGDDSDRTACSTGPLRQSRRNRALADPRRSGDPHTDRPFLAGDQLISDRGGELRIVFDFTDKPGAGQPAALEKFLP